MDRPALCEDIEITPEMIEAAAFELASYDDRFTTLREAAERIVRAAIAASRSA
jgi:hypothetical protein